MCPVPEKEKHRHFALQDRCNNSEHWAKNRYCEKRCFEAGNGYGNDCSTDGDYREDHVCGFEEELVPLAQAEKNCEEIGMKICDRTRARVFSERVQWNYSRLYIYIYI